jgi:myosin-1
MICSSTWPNYNGNDKSGIQTLLAAVNLQKDAEYGKTKIFIRTPQSITTLEEMRSAKIPELVELLQRVRK